MPGPVPVQPIQPIWHLGMSLLPQSRCCQDSQVTERTSRSCGMVPSSHSPLAVRHRDFELAFFKPVLTLLIITVLIRELLQPYMIRSVSYGEYCQGNTNEGWQSPLQQPSGVLEPCLRPEALAAHQGDPVDATGKDTAQSHTDIWPKEPHSCSCPSPPQGTQRRGLGQGAVPQLGHLPRATQLSLALR